MHIGSGLNTVSSLYSKQKSNYMKTPASGEKTFYAAETPKVYQIFETDNMLWTGGNGTGLSYCLKYADDSTDENPVVLAKVCLKPECDQRMTESMNLFKKWLNKIFY